MTIGLLLAIPLSILSGSRMIGSQLGRFGLLPTPEETLIPAVLMRQQDYLSELTAKASENTAHPLAGTGSHRDLQRDAA